MIVESFTKLLNKIVSTIEDILLNLKRYRNRLHFRLFSFFWEQWFFEVLILCPRSIQNRFLSSESTISRWTFDEVLSHRNLPAWDVPLIRLLNHSYRGLSIIPTTVRFTLDKNNFIIFRFDHWIAMLVPIYSLGIPFIWTILYSKIYK